MEDYPLPVPAAAHQQRPRGWWRWALPRLELFGPTLQALEHAVDGAHPYTARMPLTLRIATYRFVADELNAAARACGLVHDLAVRTERKYAAKARSIRWPEVVDPRTPVQCFGREASAHAHGLLDGQTVSIEMDTTQGERDIHGRLLAYIWLPDGRNFGEVMIADGFAHEYTYDQLYAYRDSFKAAQRPRHCNAEISARQGCYRGGGVKELLRAIQLCLEPPRTNVEPECQ